VNNRLSPLHPRQSTSGSLGCEYSRIRRFNACHRRSASPALPWSQLSTSMQCMQCDRRISCIEGFVKQLCQTPELGFHINPFFLRDLCTGQDVCSKAERRTTQVHRVLLNKTRGFCRLQESPGSIPWFHLQSLSHRFLTFPVWHILPAAPLRGSSRCTSRYDVVFNFNFGLIFLFSFPTTPSHRLLAPLLSLSLAWLQTAFSVVHQECN
jgi:hypothetical protein